MRTVWSELRRYPTAVAGLAIIARRDVAFGEIAPLLSIAGVGTASFASFPKSS